LTALPDMRSKKSSAGIVWLKLVLFALLGIFLGVIGKIADHHTEHIGNILSGISFWIMICTIISVSSHSPRRAAVYVLALCAAMVASYYVTAEAFDLYYSMTFACGWAIFALFSPLLAYAAWQCKGRRILSVVISCGIMTAMLFGTHLIFGIRIYDVLFALITAFFIFRSGR